VRGGVAKDGECLRIFLCQDLEVATLSERCLQVLNFAVHHDRDRIAEKPGPD